MVKKLIAFILTILSLTSIVFICGCKPSDTTSSSDAPTTYEIAPNDIWENKLKEIKAGDTILLTDGHHGSLEITQKYSGVLIKGTEDSLVENFDLYASDVTFEDLTICGAVDALTGIVCFANVNDIVVKNCVFIENGAISNNGYNINDAVIMSDTIIDGCTFSEVANTAIRITKYNNLTVKNCTFNGVGYNALQVGEHSNEGSVIIENNSFNKVKSRVLYLVKVDNLISCLIKNNIFFNHHGVYIDNESKDPFGKRKTNGVYICTKSTKENAITVGINSWVNIPEDSNKYISTAVNYDFSVQLKHIITNDR